VRNQSKYTHRNSSCVDRYRRHCHCLMSNFECVTYVFSVAYDIGLLLNFHFHEMYMPMLIMHVELYFKFIYLFLVPNNEVTLFINLTETNNADHDVIEDALTVSKFSKVVLRLLLRQSLFHLNYF